MVLGIQQGQEPILAPRTRSINTMYYLLHTWHRSRPRTSSAQCVPPLVGRLNPLAYTAGSGSHRTRHTRLNNRLPTVRHDLYALDQIYIFISML